MTQVERILVVGGGIGGLSAAIALRRAGVDVDVVEINPEWYVYGVGIIQPGNALRALDELGLARDAVAQGLPMFGDGSRFGDGQTMLADRLAPSGAGSAAGQRDHAVAAARLPADTLASGADVRLGVTVERHRPSCRGVHVDLHRWQGRRLSTSSSAPTASTRGCARSSSAPSSRRATPGRSAGASTSRGSTVWRIWVYVGTNGTAGHVPLAPDLTYVLPIEEPPHGAPVRVERDASPRGLP